MTCHNKIGGTEDRDRLSQLKAELEEIADWQEDLGCIHVVSFDSGSKQGEREREYDAEGTSERLGYAMDRLAPLGISIALENWIWNCNIEDYRKMSRSVSGVGMLLDVGHFLLCRSKGLLPPEITIEEFLRNLPVPLLEIHLHDNDGFMDSHSPVGTGILDLTDLARGLNAIGFSGIVTIEHGGPLCSEVLRNIAKSANMFISAMMEEYDRAWAF